MNSAATRIWTFSAVIAVIAIVALGWFLGISPKLAEAARFEAERIVVAGQNDLNRVTLAALQDDFNNLDEFRDQLEEIETEFPPLPQYDELSTTILTPMSSLGLVLENFLFSDPTPALPEVVLDQFGQVPSGTLLRMDGAISVQGDVSSALALITAMQTAERFILITNVVHADGRDPEARVTTISFSTFMIAGEPAEGAIQVSETPDGPEEQAANEEQPEG